MKKKRKRILVGWTAKDFLISPQHKFKVWWVMFPTKKMAKEMTQKPVFKIRITIEEI